VQEGESEGTTEVCPRKKSNVLCFQQMTDKKSTLKLWKKMRAKTEGTKKSSLLLVCLEVWERGPELLWRVGSHTQCFHPFIDILDGTLYTAIWGLFDLLG